MQLHPKLKTANQFLFRTHRRKTLVTLGVLSLWFSFCLPRPLFKDPTCMVLEDAEGSLMGARIASDGQWRFPYNDTIPDKFAKAIVEFEDRHFYRHLGVNPGAFLRAIGQNLNRGPHCHPR